MGEEEDRECDSFNLEGSDFVAPLMVLSLGATAAGKDDMEAVWVRRAEVDFWLVVPRKEDEVPVDDDPADVWFSTGKTVIVRNVSMRREAMAFSSPCWEMSGIITEKEPGRGTDTPGLNRIDALACPLIDDATELVRRRRRAFCGEPY
jgi:hypothetical protein